MLEKAKFEVCQKILAYRPATAKNFRHKEGDIVRYGKEEATFHENLRKTLLRYLEVYQNFWVCFDYSDK